MKTSDFPILKTKVKKKRLVYLDNAATTQKPKQVIKAVSDYYAKHNANVHRGIHQLSEAATEDYESAKRKVAEFVNAKFEELIFTSGTTGALNLLAYSLGKTLKKGDEIVLSVSEHHSNLVPWQQIAKEKSAKLKFIDINKDGRLDLKHAEKLITPKTKIVSVSHISNVLGMVNPVKELAGLAHRNNAILIVDGAQSAPHMSIDVKDIDCDFFAFSAHKMCGPTGIGALYGKKDLLEQMQPSIFGGGMISEVSLKDSDWAELPWKFEAGTPNIAGAIGFGEAIKYLQKIGMSEIKTHTTELTNYAYEQLSMIKGVKIYSSSDSLISFNIDGIHPHDVSTLLDREGIAVRGGHHCAMPLMKKLGAQGMVRASFYFYNTKKEVKRLVHAVKKAQEVFKK